jgi:hypothetical protein
MALCALRLKELGSEHIRHSLRSWLLVTPARILRKAFQAGVTRHVCVDLASSFTVELACAGQLKRLSFENYELEIIHSHPGRHISCDV